MNGPARRPIFGTRTARKSGMHWATQSARSHWLLSLIKCLSYWKQTNASPFCTFKGRGEVYKSMESHCGDNHLHPARAKQAVGTISACSAYPKMGFMKAIIRGHFIHAHVIIHKAFFTLASFELQLTTAGNSVALYISSCFPSLFSRLVCILVLLATMPWK